MARSELPDNWQDLAAGYVLENLSEEEVAFWHLLVQQHPELISEVEALQSLFNDLGEGVPRHRPPDGLRDRIRIAARSQFATGMFPASATRTRPRLHRWSSLGGAIAAGMIVLLGVQLYSLQSQLQQSRAAIATLERQLQQSKRDLQQARDQARAVQPVVSTLQQPDTRIYSLQGSNLANAASGRLVMSDQREVIIVVQNLPELPQDKVYRLWADVPNQLGLTYCGQFNSNAQGIIQFTPSSRQCGANPTQMLITVDAITDPTTRGGPVVMQGRI